MIELPAKSRVVVMAEGKTHALAVGIMEMSTEDMYFNVCKNSFQ